MDVRCQRVLSLSRIQLAAMVAGLCLLASACDSSEVGATETSTVPSDPCGIAPADFSPTPERVPRQSDRQRELNEENLMEWEAGLMVPLDEAVAMIAPFLVEAGVIQELSEAWDVLWVSALLDPPIPLRILDQVMPLVPEGTMLAGYAELDDGYSVQLFGATPEELSHRFEGMLASLTTTTIVPNESTTNTADRAELAGLAMDERDLRLVVPAYAIPAARLRDSGYDGLPLRGFVTGVEVNTMQNPTGWAKPSDELFTTSAGWRFCQGIRGRLAS